MKCPYLFFPRAYNCTFINEDGKCSDIATCANNGAAWCNKMIQLALTTYEYVEQMQEDSNHTL